MTRTSSSHWGAFRVDRAGGTLTVSPRPGDPDPSPLLGNIAGAHRHGSRVARPAIRRRRHGRGLDSFEEVSWPTALDLVAGELDRVRRSSGDNAIYAGSYGWASAGRFHHAQSQLHRFLALGGGYTASRNSYSLGASVVVLPHIVGRRGAHAMIWEGTDWPVIAAHTDLVVAFGGLRTANTYVTPGGRATHAFRGHLRAATARGLRVASVSPLRDDLSPELAGDWLAIRPGTDVAVMLALAHVLVSEGLADLSFLDRYTVGADRFLASLRETTPAWAAHLSGIAADAIVDLARRMAAGRTLVTVSWSLQRTPFGEQPLWAGVALAAVLGQIGLPGGGFGHGYGSIGDVGGGRLPYGLPTFPQVRNPVRDFIPCARVADLLLHPGEQFDYDGERLTYPDIRLVYWAGGNPFHHHQDLARLRRAFARPETVIVHEPYWTATARHADVVLPVTTTLERDDLGVGRGDTHLIAMQRADSPYGEARDEYAIFADLAERLGYGDAFTEGRSADEWLRQLYEDWRLQLPEAEPAAVIAGGGQSGGAGVIAAGGQSGGPEVIAAGGQSGGPGVIAGRGQSGGAGVIAGSGQSGGPGVIAIGGQSKLPDFDAFWAAGELELPGRREDTVLLADFRAGRPLDTPSGRIELFSQTVAGFGYDDCPGYPVFREPPPSPYGIVLVCNQPASRLHSQLDMGAVSQRSKVNGREPVRMHRADAAARGISDGDLVRVFNERGSLLAGARLTDACAPGVAQLSTGAWFDPSAPSVATCVHGNPNVLTTDVGTSRLSQGCTGQHARVEIALFAGDPPPVRAFVPPLEES